MMRVRPSTILLKDPVATENLILIFQCNGKHFLNINSMINCSFIHDYQRHYTLGTGTQPNHYFRWEFSSLLNATFYIGISTIYYLHPIILRVIDTINVNELFIRKENSQNVFFSKVCSNSVCRFFPFYHLIIGKQ